MFTPISLNPWVDIMTDDPSDPFYIPEFCRRKHVPKSEEQMLMSYHKRQVLAAEAETGADAPAKAKRKATPKAAAKANGEVKAAKGAKPAKAAPAKGKAAKPAAKKAKKAPRSVDPNKIDQYGFRKGTLKSRAAVMYAAKKGATLAEVKAALDSTQFNLLTQLEEQGYTVERKQEDGDGSRKVTRYKLSAKK